MNFFEALLAMKQGHKVKLPWWAGYWRWENESVWIHTAEGDDFDFRHTEDPAQTLSYMCAECWMIAD